MRRFWSAPLCLVALAVAHPAAAQETPVVEVSAGYQFLDGKDVEQTFVYQGWYADVAYNLNRVIAIVGEVGGGYHRSLDSSLSNAGGIVEVTGDQRVYELMGGVRLSGRQRSRTSWFGQVLVGDVRVSGRATAPGVDQGGIPIIPQSTGDASSYFGLQLGGGVNLSLTKAFSVRLGVDSLQVFHEREGTSFLRFVSGIVLPLSRK